MWQNCAQCGKWINLAKADYDISLIEDEQYHTHADVCTMRFLKENAATLHAIVRQHDGHVLQNRSSFLRVDSRLDVVTHR